MENTKLIKEIKNLANEVKPRQDWVSLNRDLLLHQISPAQQTEPMGVGVAGYFGLFFQLFKTRALEPVVVMFLLFAVFLSSSLTINAAFYSLPGNPLYNVKLALERTHAAMVIDEQDSVELKIELAQKRVNEIQKIASSQSASEEEKQAKINTVVKEFKNNVTAINQHVAKIASQTDNADKEKTIKMAISLNAKIQDLATALDKSQAVASQTEVTKMVQEVAQNLATLAEKENATDEGQVKGAQSDSLEDILGENETTTPKLDQ